MRYQRIKNFIIFMVVYFCLAGTAGAVESSTESLGINANIPIRETGTLLEFSTPKDYYQTANVPLKVKFKNEGNTTLQPNGKIEIYDLKSKLYDTIILNENVRSVEPNSTIELNFVWSPKFPITEENYKAVLTFGYGSGGSLSDELTFSVKPTELPVAVGEVIEEVVGEAEKNIEQVKEGVKPIIEQPPVEATKKVINIIAPVVIIITLTLPRLLNWQLLNSFFWIIAQIIFLYVLRPHKRKPWGRVVDSETNQPIPGARVVIYDGITHNELANTNTDWNGRFTFLLNSGKYYIVILKEGYTFPSSYDINSYRGESFCIEDEQITELEIKLDHNIKSLVKQLFPYYLANQAMIALKTPLIIISILLTGCFYLYGRDVYDGIMLFVYLAFLAYERIILINHKKSYGVITDEKCGLPIKSALVRIYNSKSGKLLVTTFSDARGRFVFLLSRGNYYLTVTKEKFVSKKTTSFECKNDEVYTGEIRLKSIEIKN